MRNDPKKIRQVDKILESKQVIEGAGVKLNRVFGDFEAHLFDPFLLLDHFKSENPDDYMAGFPWHPHRGIETVTYILKGTIEHSDSLGNKGIIKSGDIQWMTAGSGIIHQEMPKTDKSGIEGFQLWVNLPRDKKMMIPRYQNINGGNIPEIKLKNNVKVKVISGEVEGIKGPVEDIITNPDYLDIEIPLNSNLELDIEESKKVFIYIYRGSGYFDDDKKVAEKNVVLFTEGNAIQIITKDEEIKFLLISGIPIKEKIAWNGPIVMNNQEEIQLAFEEIQNGTFLKA